MGSCCLLTTGYVQDTGRGPWTPKGREESLSNQVGRGREGEKSGSGTRQAPLRVSGGEGRFPHSEEPTPHQGINKDREGPLGGWESEGNTASDSSAHSAPVSPWGSWA